jgi:hypothetical protein
LITPARKTLRQRPIGGMISLKSTQVSPIIPHD